MRGQPPASGTADRFTANRRLGWALFAFFAILTLLSLAYILLAEPPPR